MRNLIPSYVFDTIYEITPELLLQNGARGMLIDLDGTMASRHAPTPPKTLRPFLHGFLEEGIEVLVLSNNSESRVRVFCEGLDVPWLSRAGKPMRRGFRHGAAVLGMPISECAVVGDQIYTDTIGGNRAGAAMTCYVQSLDLTDFWIRLRYRFERGFIARGKKRMEERLK